MQCLLSYNVLILIIAYYDRGYHGSYWLLTWWRFQMETFSALLAICAGNSPVPVEFPTQMPVTLSFDVYFDLRPNKRLRKLSWGGWFETPSRPLCRHRNEMCIPRDRSQNIHGAVYFRVGNVAAITCLILVGNCVFTDKACMLIIFMKLTILSS